MADLYTWPTPNGHKVAIMLEETGLVDRVHPIDIASGVQITPEYETLNPNGKNPTIVTVEPIGVLEYIIPANWIGGPRGAAIFDSADAIGDPDHKNTSMIRTIRLSRNGELPMMAPVLRIAQRRSRRKRQQCDNGNAR